MSETILGDKPAPNSLVDYSGKRGVNEKYTMRMVADPADLACTRVVVRWEIFYGCRGREQTIFKGSFATPADAVQAAADAIRAHREGTARANELVELMAEYHR